MHESPLFCSIDLELTGFDPASDEILEVGFVLFSVSGGVITEHERWEQVFKPRRPVRSKILALTGISEEEIANAPAFADFHAFLQEKLSSAILVGHSIAVDARFLEASGILLSGRRIDTIDIVQFMLPTHNSYNLENLTHLFGIEHQQAHRALADCLATKEVVASLINMFRSFPKSLQEKMIATFSGKGFDWEPFFTGIEHSVDSTAAPVGLTSGNYFYKNTRIESGVIYNTSLGAEKKVLPLPAQQQPALVVFEKTSDVLEVVRSGQGTAIFPVGEVFDSAKFEKLRARPNLEESEILFVLKILVWQGTNWQQETILDINWSAFGRQFKHLVTKESVSIPDSNILVTDHETFLTNLQFTSFPGRQIIIKSIDLFEHKFSASQGVQLSWNRIIAILKGIYNPETELGEQTHKDVVLELLAGVDLFFGVLNLLLKNSPSQLIDMDSVDAYVLNKIDNAGHKYLAALEKAQQDLKNAGIALIIQKLSIFLQSGNGWVRWVDISATHCGLHAQPLALISNANSVYSDEKKVSFYSTLEHQKLVLYYTQRLLATTLRIQNEALPVQEKIPAVSQGVLSDLELLEEILESKKTVVVFKDYESLRKFYEDYYAFIKERTKAFVQGFSGGLSKMTLNYANFPEGILMLTPEFASTLTAGSLQADKLIFVGLPEVNFHHPYVQKLALSYADGVDAFQALKNTELLYSLLKIVSFETLRSVLFVNETQSSFLNTFFEPLHEFSYYARK